MKIALNGTKVRAFKGVDKNGHEYEFVTVWGRTGDNKQVRTIFNNKMLYRAITSNPTLTVLDSVEVETSGIRERTFTGRDGSVSVLEAVDPVPTGIEKAAFPTTSRWPEWGELMKAVAPASADAPAAAEAEAEF